MSAHEDEVLATPIWPSIDDIKPGEEGGSIARTGFNYQDEIAVGFLIEMLEQASVVKVHFETHDDIVVVRRFSGAVDQIAEYIQVKGNELDQLWSIANIGQRKAGKAGTSIFEASLSRDRHSELSLFRLVTLRPVVGYLRPLTYPLDAPGRNIQSEEMKALCTDLCGRFPEVKSPKGNDATFWLEHCFWDERHSERVVRQGNFLRLFKLGCAEGRSLLTEPLDILLEELRHMAKTAGAAKWMPYPESKVITRSALRSWWDSRTFDILNGAKSTSGNRLHKKMSDAKLSDDLIEMAKELRRGYSAETRSPKYLKSDQADRLRRRVLSEVASLRSSFLAADTTESPISFHSKCIGQMDLINSKRPSTEDDHSAFLKGCLYDIADRCLLRFDRPSQ